MLLGLSTGQKVGLLIAAGIFIAFALAASFYFPRRNPDFPGHRLGSFVALTVVLFLGTLTAVFVLAKEDEAEAEGHGEVVATETVEEGEEGPAATGGETGETGETGAEDRPAIRRPARRSSPRPAAAAATRSPTPAHRETSARTSTSRSRATSSPSTGSRTDRARCPRSATS